MSIEFDVVYIATEWYEYKCYIYVSNMRMLIICICIFYMIVLAAMFWMQDLGANSCSRYSYSVLRPPCFQPRFWHFDPCFDAAFEPEK